VTPFLEFRSWLRSGPAAERLLTCVAGSVVLAMLVWASLPVEDGARDGAATDALLGGSPTTAGADGSAAGVNAGAAAGGASGSDRTVVSSASSGRGAGATPSTGSGAGGPTGSTPGTATRTPGTTSTTGCGALTATDVGVTARQILVGVSLPDLGGLGTAFNVPSFEDQRRGWEAVFAVRNRAGGVQCRKLVPKYYRDDVTSSTAEHATCLQMQQDKVFAVIQNFYFPSESTCLARAKIPNLWYIPPHTDQVKHYHPYILSYQPDYDRLVRSYVRGAQGLRWFAGHKKVGVLEGTCFPDLNRAIDRELTAIGIAPSERSTFNYGCDPGAPSQPEKDTQAVLQFKREGVTHVLSVAYGRSFSFSSVGDGQDYRPKYAVMDDGQVAGSNHGASPVGQSFDGALAIAVSQQGAVDTPGLAVRPATAECRRIMRAAKLPDPLTTSGAAYGLPCAGVEMFVQAAARAPGLTRRSLATGLAGVGELDLSFPAGPVVFGDRANPSGGGFWRPLKFDHAANCWRVASPAFRKDFG
jgi:hypothetical protein